MIVPGTLLLVGLIGGVGAAATYATYAYAEKVGPELGEELNEGGRGLIPMSPDEGPPLPRSLGVRWPWRKNG